MRSIAGVLVAILLLTTPTAVLAQSNPFGGPITTIIFCYNQAIWTIVGPPVGGIYIWTPSTVTYPFGPPSHVGQYLLGLYGAPYYCLVSILPIIVFAGISITMMGSSGPSGGSLPPATPEKPPVPVPTVNHADPGMTPEQVEAARLACQKAYPACIWN